LTNEYSFKFAFTPGLPGIVNMGIDLRLGRDAPPCVPAVRFFTWESETISLGCNQDPGKRIDLDLCRRDGIEVVRRPTGGRELLHGHDLCYSVVWPTADSLTAIEAGEIFGRINEILVSALQRLNIKASWRRCSRGRGASSGPCFALIDRGEISVNGKKLLASAQRIFKSAVLQQGSMPLVEPAADLIRYLKVNDGMDRRGELARVSTYLNDHVDETFTVSSIVEIFEGEFERFFGSEADALQVDPKNMDLMYVESERKLDSKPQD
jgi:lipoate-protein ligase A